MRKCTLLVLISICWGCSDLDLYSVPWHMVRRNDGPGCPDYHAKRESTVIIMAPYAQVTVAARDALHIIGCQKVNEEENGFRGERAFIPAFVSRRGG